MTHVFWHFNGWTSHNVRWNFITESYRIFFWSHYSNYLNRWQAVPAMYAYLFRENPNIQYTGVGFLRSKRVYIAIFSKPKPIFKQKGLKTTRQTKKEANYTKIQNVYESNLNFLLIFRQHFKWLIVCMIIDDNKTDAIVFHRFCCLFFPRHRFLLLCTYFSSFRIFFYLFFAR